MYMSPHSDIYIYIYKKIYFRELAHAIIEAEKSQELQSANWKPRRASGITSKKKKKKKESQQAGGSRKINLTQWSIVLSSQSCPTLCNPVACSLLGSSLQRVYQTRILEWVAIPSCRASSQPRDQTCISSVSCIDRQILYHQRHLGSAAAAAAKSLQSCRTLCNPVDGSPPGSPVPGILQAGMEWVAISFSNA